MTQALLIRFPASTIRRRPAAATMWTRLVRPLRDLMMGPIDRLARAADVGQVLETRTADQPRPSFALRRFSPCAAFKHLKHLT